MAGGRLYLDWNASAPLRPEARAAMAAALDSVGNPSSQHAEGRAARAALETARRQVAALIHAAPNEIVFTSGATEAVNMVLKGRAWSRVRVGAGEHAAVRAAAEAAAAAEEGVFETTPMRPDGGLDTGAAARPFAGGGAFLAALSPAQGETGAAEPPGGLAAVERASGACVFADATQLAGKEIYSEAGVAGGGFQFDTAFAAISAHKFGGPRGVGAVVIRDGEMLTPLLHGGGQELHRRSGTENVLGAVGMGAAAAAARRDLDAGVWEDVRRRRDYLEAALLTETPGLQVIAGQTPWRLANTLAVAAPGRSAESMLIKLDLGGVAVSAGSACSSGKMTPSPVLKAMATSPEVARCVVRISLGPITDEAEVDRFIAAWRRAMSR